ncbi:hypothetical protein [Pseudomonas sp.]|uniref:hypothetical protein n=1 Tax=Pseudomonas sp. TaxID=306 RepID=UPI00257BD283|nr:hypothetical protein [Pseudomonas sp.]
MSEVKRYIALGPMFEPDELLVGGYVLAGDYDNQAQEIERLEVEISEQWRMRRELDAQNDTNKSVISELRAELSQLKSRQSGDERGHDTKGSRKAMGAMNAKLRAKVGRLERELTALSTPNSAEQLNKAQGDHSEHDIGMVKPVAYAVFAVNGNVMCFSTDCGHGSLKVLELSGYEIQPLYTAPPSIPAVSEMELDKYGLGYPLHKEQAVQLWHKGFRSEPITVLEAWEAIGHDIGCNPSKDELFDSLRNMSEICRTHGFDTPSIPETSVVVGRELLDGWRIERNGNRIIVQQPNNGAGYSASRNGDSGIAESVLFLLAEAMLSSKGGAE